MALTPILALIIVGVEDEAFQGSLTVFGAKLKEDPISVL